MPRQYGLRHWAKWIRQGHGSSPRVRGTHHRCNADDARARFIPAGAGNTPYTRANRSSSSVHPRGCGEHHQRHEHPWRYPGSSPRVRGTPRRHVGDDLVQRFIPAGAGNTTQVPVSSFGAPVHPRGCGEHVVAQVRVHLLGGSSPRVRGTRPMNALLLIRTRFIPAGAGNTFALWPYALCHTVHPRGCGEHATPIARTQRANGSSPRVRGTLSTGMHAGHRRLVHPRGCGEHLNRFHSGVTTAGSSPRVRGTLPRRVLPELRRRFIPAGAGNTSPPSTAPCAPAVHPRGCGEHELQPDCCLYSTGSSPRVRGTHADRVRARTGRRFIPAGAGNTPTGWYSDAAGPVHPRGCGEHSTGAPALIASSGSSPRVRGTQHRRTRIDRIQRFIPAGAGNTSPYR